MQHFISISINFICPPIPRGIENNVSAPVYILLDDLFRQIYQISNHLCQLSFKDISTMDLTIGENLFTFLSSRSSAPAVRRKEAKSHWLHLLDFSPVYVFKCFSCPPAPVLLKEKIVGEVQKLAIISRCPSSPQSLPRYFFLFQRLSSSCYIL